MIPNSSDSNFELIMHSLHIVSQIIYPLFVRLAFTLLYLFRLNLQTQAFYHLSRVFLLAIRLSVVRWWISIWEVSSVPQGCLAGPQSEKRIDQLPHFQFLSSVQLEVINLTFLRSARVIFSWRSRSKVTPFCLQISPYLWKAFFFNHIPSSSKFSLPETISLQYAYFLQS